MINEPTVLVLGAGSSHLYGFPTAAELKARICATLVEPTPISQRLGENFETLFDFREAFYRPGLSSIDRFLELRPEFLPVGKLAIAFSLMSFEEEERLYRRDGMRGGDWYAYLSEKLN